MSGICKDEKRVCLCAEMTEDLSVKQEEWQLFVEGGTLQIASKGVTSKPHVVKQHLFMTGNQFPRKFKNNAKQISRRCFLVLFNYLVPKSTVDTNILDELKQDTDKLLRKCACAYMEAVRLYGNGQDLEAPGVMPDMIRGFMQTLETSIDPLTSYLESGRFVFDVDAYMPLDDFKTDYFEYRRANGFPAVPWTRDSYQSCFQSKELFIQRTALEYGGNMRSRTDFLMGIELAPED